MQNVFVTNWPVGMGSGGNSVIGGGKGAGMLGKAGVAGMGAAMITPLVEEGLDMAFGDSQYYANIKYAQNWSDFVGAAFGQDTVKKGPMGSGYGSLIKIRPRIRLINSIFLLLRPLTYKAEHWERNGTNRKPLRPPKPVIFVRRSRRQMAKSRLKYHQKTVGYRLRLQK